MNLWLTSVFTDAGHDSMYMAAANGTAFLKALHAPVDVGMAFNRTFLMDEVRACRAVYNSDLGFYEVAIGHSYVEAHDPR